MQSLPVDLGSSYADVVCIGLVPIKSVTTYPKSCIINALIFRTSPKGQLQLADTSPELPKDMTQGKHRCELGLDNMDISFLRIDH